METTGTNGQRLIERLRKEKNIHISPTLLSFILRGSRRCSLINAVALHEITGVPIDVLREWPRLPLQAKRSPRRRSRVA